MSPENIKTIAHLLAGYEPGWQSRFAALLGTSRGYAHNLLTGERPLTQRLAVRIIEVSDEQAAALRDRAATLDGVRARLLPDPSGPMTLPQMTDEEYDRQADEAEAIINELAGVTGNDSEEGKKS